MSLIFCWFYKIFVSLKSEKFAIIPTKISK